MPAPIRAILFDKDGTLIDFEQTWGPAYRQAARKVADYAGQPGLETELLEAGGWCRESNSWRAGSLLASGSNEQIIECWKQLINDRRRQDIENLVTRTFFEHAANAPAPLCGINELIPLLNANQFVLGVATMDDENIATRSLGVLGLSQYFKFICGADSGFGIKPEAGMVHGFCRQCGLQTGEVLMIGDSPHDLNMGRAAGVGLVVGVLSGAHDAGVLNPLADYVITDATRLPSLLGIAA